jgi:hypothetical protein
MVAINNTKELIVSDFLKQARNLSNDTAGEIRSLPCNDINFKTCLVFPLHFLRSEYFYLGEKHDGKGMVNNFLDHERAKMAKTNVHLDKSGDVWIPVHWIEQLWDKQTIDYFLKIAQKPRPEPVSPDAPPGWLGWYPSSEWITRRTSELEENGFGVCENPDQEEGLHVLTHPFNPCFILRCEDRKGWVIIDRKHFTSDVQDELRKLDLLRLFE